MARSVYVPSRAAQVVYASFESDSDYWEDAIDNLKGCLQYRYPSLESPRSPRWIGREGRVILENKHASIVVSEYCGLVAISVVVEAGHGALSERWCERCDLSGMAECFGQELVPGPRFSNGEQMFSAKGAPNKGDLGLGFSSKEGWI